ncbi:MAG TPA: TetR/AcrR family transcriptional regulator [Sorangium sp.]|nr:TetR/AcrR family transcriptional regulator [Sorangium sp.]
MEVAHKGTGATPLTRAKWLDHGLASLTAHGPSALKADKLAHSLGVSRGSFYWHFKNLADFHAALLHHWLDVTVGQVVADLTHPRTPRQRIHALVERAANNDAGDLERAVRAWALQADDVQRMVSEVDAQRVGYLRSCLDEMAPRANNQARALVLYMMAVGTAMVAPTLSSSRRQQVIDELMHIVDR